MAIQFPANPTAGDRYSDAGVTWEWNGEGWNIVSPDLFAEWDATRTYVLGESFIWPGRLNSGASHIYQVIVGPTTPGDDPDTSPASFAQTMSATGRMRGYMDPTQQDGGVPPFVPGKIVDSDPDGVFETGDYVICSADSDQLYDTTTGTPTTGPTAIGIRLFRGDRLVINQLDRWTKLDPPERNNWGLFDANVAGGGAGLLQPVINGSKWYQVRDFVTVLYGGRYNFNTGQPDPAGELLTEGQILAYNGTDFFSTRSLENFFIGFFDPTMAGGGPDLPDPIIDGTTQYNAGEYVIASAAGAYDFDTGQPSAIAGGREVNPSDHILYDGTVWTVLSAANSPARGFMDPTKAGGQPPAPFPVVNGSANYSVDDYLFVQGAGTYNFISGTPGTGVSLVQGDKLVYTGAAWLKINVAAGLVKGQFNPTIANGGPSVDHPVVNNSIEYAAREMVIASASGWYAFGTGTPGAGVGAVWVRKGWFIFYSGTVWTALPEDGDSNWGWFDPTVVSTAFPPVTNSTTQYADGDWFNVQTTGFWDFVGGAPNPAGTQLSAGDVIRRDIANNRWQLYTAGAGGGVQTIDVTQNNHGFAANDPVKVSTTGVWAKAQADSAANLKVGTVSEVTSANTFKVMTAGLLIKPAHGLQVGVQYYLSATAAGGYSTAAPVVTNQFVQPVFIPMDANTLYIQEGEVVRRI
jgi:hypothetical protein